MSFFWVTAIGGLPKPEICFLPRRLGWTLLPKERHGDSVSGCGSHTKFPIDTWTLYHCAIQGCGAGAPELGILQGDGAQIKIGMEKNLELELWPFEK